MKYKIFGKHSGLYVSELILGGAMFGQAKGYGANKDEALNILKGYANAGGNFIDTADAYQNGESEKIIGEFIAPNRNDYVLATKFTRSANPYPSIGIWGNNRKAMVQSIEQSLKRLKTDRIDIYIAHFDDGITPAEEVARGLDDLVCSGKIVYGGFSNYPAWKIATAVNTANLRGLAPIIALQAEYSLVQRVPESELLPMAENFGLGVMAYSPLASGLLTGKYRKKETGRINLLKNEAQITNFRNEAILDKLIDIAAETGVSPANIAVAWISSKGLFPVIGPRVKTHLDDYLAAVMVKLTHEHIVLLDDVSKIPLEYPHNINKLQQNAMLER